MPDRGIIEFFFDSRKLAQSQHCFAFNNIAITRNAMLYENRAMVRTALCTMSKLFNGRFRIKFAHSKLLVNSAPAPSPGLVHFSLFSKTFETVQRNVKLFLSINTAMVGWIFIL